MKIGSSLRSFEDNLYEPYRVNINRDVIYATIYKLLKRLKVREWSSLKISLMDGFFYNENRQINTIDV